MLFLVRSAWEADLCRLPSKFQKVLTFLVVLNIYQSGWTSGQDSRVTTHVPD